MQEDKLADRVEARARRWRRGLWGRGVLQGLRRPKPLDGRASAAPAEARPLVLVCCQARWHAPLARALVTSLNAEVHAAERSSETLRTARALGYRSQPVALVIHELGHPRVLSLLRASLPDVPLITIGSRGTLEERLRAAASGADAFLAQPVRISEIARVAHQILHVSADARGLPGVPIPSSHWM